MQELCQFPIDCDQVERPDGEIIYQDEQGHYVSFLGGSKARERSDRMKELESEEGVNFKDELRNWKEMHPPTQEN
ncbi:uncharacterized protein L201_003176 [Kwoniella dendrophila CBS 6074]|uniref:Uncharacterized protein n=1 Tax=Kwoniella dendrophila CBS 6074 TaxID=1295534 RepID=A0AAX4JTX4_9TREE